MLKTNRASDFLKNLYCKMLKKLVFYVLIFSFFQTQGQNLNQVSKENDSLKQVIQSLSFYLSEIENTLPNVLIRQIKTTDIQLTLYIPFGLDIALTSQRPEISDSVYFCIPAAYTAKDTTIDGLYIINGRIADSVFNEKLTGACIMDGQLLQIIKREELSKRLINQIIQDSFSFFQQSILVRNSEIVICDLFKERKNIRRALVIFPDYSCIAESVDQVTILEFQKSLIESGAIDAIYLDMGTWSEGWYKNNKCEIKKIGEKFYNTHLQTNWLIFKTLN